MITRIVRMTFRPDKCEAFEAIFHASKDKIRSFEGCEYLALYEDHHHESVYYTISYWKSQQDLDNYRNSDLFKSTWTKTKALFAEKPQAFSLEKQVELP